MTDAIGARVRKLLLGLPEVSERLSHGAPCFYIREKKPLCYFHDAEFSHDGRVSLWCPSTDDVQQELIATAPDRFFAPTPSASGIFAEWVGIYLDVPDVDWHEVQAIVHDAYRLRAPKTLANRLDPS